MGLSKETLLRGGCDGTVLPKFTMSISSMKTFCRLRPGDQKTVTAHHVTAVLITALCMIGPRSLGINV
jgi:hypothetical protein